MIVDQELIVTTGPSITGDKFLKDTASLVRDIESRFIELGMRLWKIREAKLWNSGYESYEDFLDSSKISPSTASKLVKVVEFFIVQGGANETQLIGAPYSSLYEAIPLLASEDVQTVIAKVLLLSRGEIKEEVREEKHGDCSHLEQILICVGCKKRIYHAETSDKS